MKPNTKIILVHLCIVLQKNTQSNYDRTYRTIKPSTDIAKICSVDGEQV